MWPVAGTGFVLKSLQNQRKENGCSPRYTDKDLWYGNTYGPRMFNCLRGSNKARRLRLFPFTLDHTWATEENTQLKFFKSDSYANLFQLLFFSRHPPRSPPWNRGGVALGLSLLTGQSERLQNSIDGERLSIELCTWRSTIKGLNIEWDIMNSKSI